MDGLAGYASDGSENSSNSTPKKVSPVSVAVEVQNTEHLASEWENFEKLLGDAAFFPTDTTAVPSAVPPVGDHNNHTQRKSRSSSSSSESSRKSSRRSKSPSDMSISDASSSRSSSPEKETIIETLSLPTTSESTKAEHLHVSNTISRKSRSRSGSGSPVAKSRSSSSSHERPHRKFTERSSSRESIDEKSGKPEDFSPENTEQSGKVSQEPESTKRRSSSPHRKEIQPSKERKSESPKKPRQRSRSPKRRRSRSPRSSRKPSRSPKRRRSRSTERKRRRSKSKSREGKSRTRRSRSRDRKVSRSDRGHSPKSKDSKEDRKGANSKERKRSRSQTRRRRHSRSRSRDRKRRHRARRSPSRDRFGRRRRRSRERSISRTPSPGPSRSRGSRKTEPAVERKKNEPLTFKQKLKQSLIDIQRQAAKGELSVDSETAQGDLQNAGEKPSHLPLSDNNPYAGLIPAGGPVTPQQALLQTMAAMHQKAQQLTGVAVPKYYNPAAVNPLKYAEQFQKRKLLWSKAKEHKEEGTATWGGVRFQQDSGGNVAAKFRKLMGIKKEGEEETPATVEEENNIPQPSADLMKNQDDLFQRLDKEYEFARMTTHTHRGIGLGFQSLGLPDK